ncbi:MAG: DMT family transporter [Okeania sp. SIO3I5]|uniref:DMT family transporter n=1 Tax=Okeania sp. SIO3I5 TaxID=2607805 RepID=UPI0013B885B3|nr:DMT family transporter [Okeania sp. SIO3I5]NEQ39038.1 DMT family transporter [Okeania sp. SIO3I5]
MKSIQEQTSIQESVTAIILLAIAIIACSWIAIFFRLLEREIGPFATAFHRVWLATFVLGIWNRLQALRYQFSTDNVEQQPYTSWVLIQLLIAGICFAGDQVLWAWSLTQTSVANSTLLTNLNPLWTTLLAWSIWGQHFDKRFLIGMGVAMVGACIIGIEDLQVATGNLQGDGVAVLASICFSIYLLIVEKLREKFSAETILFWSSLFSTLWILPIVLVMEDRLFPYSWQSWVLVILLGFVCQILGQGLVNYCLKRLSSAFVAISLLLAPVITAILAWIIFSESLSLLNGVAFAVVLLGIYLAKSSSSAIKE